MMRIDTLERTVRRLKRRRNRQRVTEIMVWEPGDDGTYVNYTTRERVSELPRRPGLVHFVIREDAD